MLIKTTVIVTYDGTPVSVNEEDNASSNDEMSEVDDIEGSQSDSDSRSSSDSKNEPILDPISKGSPSFGAGFVQVGRR